MKTLIIYNPIDEELKYVIVDGDYSKFHGACINSMNGNGFENEFCDFFFHAETGKFKYKLTNDKSLIENKQWDRIAVVTWLP